MKEMTNMTAKAQQPSRIGNLCYVYAKTKWMRSFKAFDLDGLFPGKLIYASLLDDSDDLSTLSKSKKNEATDIIDDFIAEDDVWVLYFEKSDCLGYEIQLKVDNNGHKTLKAHKAITWLNDVVVDSQHLKVTVR